MNAASGDPAGLSTQQAEELAMKFQRFWSELSPDEQALFRAALGRLHEVPLDVVAYDMIEPPDQPPSPLVVILQVLVDILKQLL